MPASIPTEVKAARGGSFLIEDLNPQDVFTPEDFTEEHRQIARAAQEFATREILPAAGSIEAKDFEVTRQLLRKAGELGLLAVDIPEAYGGLELDKVTSALVAESLSKNGSFSVSFGAHSGIGTLPLVWYGTGEQKKKYLPKLATGEWIAAYALSEASSGSDAMNIRARAVLSSDGTHYLLSGEKMWISNAGFADLFTVFAKIDGQKFSAFLIERTAPGLAIGPEEHKIGIRGSSTCPLVLNNCQVPVENLLGEAGKGHHIAFNILNIGRFKLGAACLGGARTALQTGLEYARERKAFGKPIARFGLIQEKIADCAVSIYVAESLTYRTIGMIDAALATVDVHAPGASHEIQKRIEEYAVECSILKVWSSEMLDRVVDHVVQIYGGYGFVEDYPAARAYCDSRINRIFEGTNEINRLIITGWLLKRSASGQLPLLAAIKRLMDEIIQPQLRVNLPAEGLARERAVLTNLKKITLLAAGAASQKHPTDMQDQQELMSALANCTIQIYALESSLLRAEKLVAMSSPLAKNASLSTSLYSARALTLVEAAATRVLAAVAEGDALRTQMALVRRLTKLEPLDSIALSRQLCLRIL